MIQKVASQLGDIFWHDSWRGIISVFKNIKIHFIKVQHSPFSIYFKSCFKDKKKINIYKTYTYKRFSINKEWKIMEKKNVDKSKRKIITRK